MHVLTIIRVSGLLGVPAPNGLIPQAPMHTESLLVMGVRRKDDPEKPAEFRLAGIQNYEPHARAVSPPTGEQTPVTTDVFVEERPIAVVEQRVSNLAQGALCVVLMTGPFQHVLGLVPRGVLAGLL